MFVKGLGDFGGWVCLGYFFPVSCPTLLFSCFSDKSVNYLHCYQ